MHICTHVLERPHASMNVHPLQVKQTISDGWSELQKEEQQEWGEGGVGPCPVSWTVAEGSSSVPWRWMKMAAAEEAAPQKAQLEKAQLAQKAAAEKAAQKKGYAQMREDIENLKELLERERTVSAAALEKAQSEKAVLERAELERVVSERAAGAGGAGGAAAADSELASLRAHLSNQAVSASPFSASPFSALSPVSASPTGTAAQQSLALLAYAQTASMSQGSLLTQQRLERVQAAELAVQQQQLAMLVQAQQQQQQQLLPSSHPGKWSWSQM
jgi:hypothetical protein